MVDGKGYWINMEAAATLIVAGTEMPPPGEMPPEYPVFQGWNHIGFKSTSPMRVCDYLGEDVMAIFGKMWSFDTETGWERVHPGDNLYPGMGYWLTVGEDGTIFPGGVQE